MAMSMDDANRVSCFFLTQNSYGSSALWVEVAKAKKATATVLHSQESIVLVAEVKTHWWWPCHQQ